MAQSAFPIVDVDWLKAHLDDPDVVVMDASIGNFRLFPRSVRGARPFDIDGDLSDHAVDLPHTMPSPNSLAGALRELGVRGTDHIVLYDAQGVYSSPRAFWMLRAIGHSRCSVLDGGLPAWEAAGGEIVDLPASYSGPCGDLEAAWYPSAFVDREAVSDALVSHDSSVLDARSWQRFVGAAPEPRKGLRSGHMPGAVNVPFTSLLAEERFLPPEQLGMILNEVAPRGRPVITSCGSGVTACVVALAALLAGYGEVSVYDGSWSDWGAPGRGEVVSADEPEIYPRN